MGFRMISPLDPIRWEKFSGDLKKSAASLGAAFLDPFEISNYGIDAGFDPARR